ncbi:MAG: hypothetical protein IK092_04785 [Muribaculaceae bacterium]|nr:hypothetical protein [Muribaculaceae bacterium]
MSKHITSALKNIITLAAQTLLSLALLFAASCSGDSPDAPTPTPTPTPTPSDPVS